MKTSGWGHVKFIWLFYVTHTTARGQNAIWYLMRPDTALDLIVELHQEVATLGIEADDSGWVLPIQLPGGHNLKPKVQ